jgi:hypothetical protein
MVSRRSAKLYVDLRIAQNRQQPSGSLLPIKVIVALDRREAAQRLPLLSVNPLLAMERVGLLSHACIQLRRIQYFKCLSIAVFPDAYASGTSSITITDYSI